MNKQEARKLADKFAAACPELVGRPVRMTLTADWDRNQEIVTRWSKVPRSPRGGLGKPVQFAWGHSGSLAITTVPAGTIVQVSHRERKAKAFTASHYWIVYPHHEDDRFSDMRWQEEFSREEATKSTQFAIDNDLEDESVYFARFLIEEMRLAKLEEQDHE